MDRHTSTDMDAESIIRLMIIRLRKAEERAKNQGRRVTAVEVSTAIGAKLRDHTGRSPIPPLYGLPIYEYADRNGFTFRLTRKKEVAK